ncbi:MAG: MarR family transcriptional regulator [Propionibacteriaceae bacterium]|nr:MarR family transcriptional regulator [Propionibacteriaceae bacterium]
MDLTDRQVIFAGVMLLANRMQAAYDARLDGLTLKQWLALTVVNALPQPVPSTAVVAEALGTSHQNVTKLLVSLADKGLVVLEPSPLDRRARQVRVTPAAQDLFATNDQWGDRVLAELFATARPDDLAACRRVLEGMSRVLTGKGLTPEEG